VGQNVIVKLENFPFEEWGSLTGTIKSISEVPKQDIGEESYYTLFIIMNDLTTSYGGYFGSISASHFGVIVPVVSVQTVPFFLKH